MFELAEIVGLKNEAEEFLEYMGLTSYKKNVFLYGCGAASVWYIKFMKKHHIRITGFIDGMLEGKDEKILGGGHKVQSLEYVVKNNENLVIVISAPMHEKAIRNRIDDNDGTSIPVFSFDPTLEILQEVSIAEQRAYIIENFENYKQFYNVLVDDWSKRTLAAVLKGRYTSSNRFYKEIVSKPQYFPDIIKNHLSEQEVFCDVGAYTGDSIDEFIEAVDNKFEKVIALEPDINNAKVAGEKYNCDNRIEIIIKGASSENGKVYFNNENGELTDEGAHIVDNESDSTASIEVIKLDDLFNENITYLKMDIEGMESAAMEGAKRIIKENHPKLAISVYHKVDDILKISKQIMEFDSSYKLYLRHYWESCGTDTILFAI